MSFSEAGAEGFSVMIEARESQTIFGRVIAVDADRALGILRGIISVMPFNKIE